MLSPKSVTSRTSNSGGREAIMTEQKLDRRDFLKTAVVGGAAAAGGSAAILTPETAQAEPAAPAATAVAPQPAGYTFLSLDEAAFVESLVDHMVPADEISPKGTDLGINVYIDRALAGAWGKGERLYMQGPWRQGTSSQGYPIAVDACAALSRRHRGHQRALPQG